MYKHPGLLVNTIFGIIKTMEIQVFDSSMERFISKLDKPAIAKILRTIDLLEKFGHNLGLPHSKKVSASLFELRIHSAQNVRILYTFHKSKIFLLHAFIKKSQKIPQRELNTAFQKLKNLI